MTAREEVLSRIHAALAQARPAPPVPREYRTETGEPAGGSEVVSRFLERVEDYQAHVYRATPADLAKILDTVIPAEHRVVLPPALPAEWHVRIAARAATSYVDGSPTSLSATELDAIDMTKRDSSSGSTVRRTPSKRTHLPGGNPTFISAVRRSS